MKLTVLLLILLLPLLTLAQQSDSQIAYNYYNNKEYSKAAEYFLQLYERTHSRNYLDFHIVSLINGKEYDKAETTLRKYIKTDESNKEYLINLGYVYEQQGKMSKAEDCFDKAVKKLIPYQNDIINVANYFRNILAYDWATKTYLKGRELLKQPNAFSSELGDNYMMARDYEQMTDLFFQSLEIKPGEINNITSKLRFARTYDVGGNVDMLLEDRLSIIFKNPKYNSVFDELAVWLALQKSDYTKAFSHAVLLNTKAENKVNIYIDIARESSASKQYTIALNAYNKVLEKGKENNDFYNIAVKEILSCKYAEIQEKQPDLTPYKELAGECEKYMKETGYNAGNIDIITMLSDIYAYQLNLPDSSNQILQRGGNIPRLDNRTLNTIKSKRADLLAFMDNPWEATILYTQIEKANPNNDVGYEAKLKKAFLAYYAGDLLWAKAQFDVLKGSTSKLISNDAIKMSHFINNNYDEDSDNKEMLRTAEAEYLIYRKRNMEAKLVLDSIITAAAPGVSDYAALQKAQVFISEFNYNEAESILTKLKNTSEQTYIKAEAIYELAGLKAKTAAVPEAMELYKSLVSDYPGSVHSIDAGRLYRELEKN